MTDYSVSGLWQDHASRADAGLNALTTLLLAASLIAVTVGYRGYRGFTRGEQGAGAIDGFTGGA
jgi:hypothetical protein